MPIRPLFALLSALCTAVSASAQEPLVFGEGEAAPGLHVGTWVLGTPVTRLERGRVYLVEFWASWCPASRRAISRLTALQRAHPDDLTVLAISSRDQQGETLDHVRLFVGDHSAEIGYSVGFDERRRTSREWLDGFDVRSVPTAFLVDRTGTIVWIGNPLWPPGELEGATARVLAGPFSAADRAALHAVYVERRERIARVERELSDMGLGVELGRAVRLLETLIEINPEGAPAYSVRRFELLLADPTRVKEAYAYGNTLVDGLLHDDSERLDRLANAVLSEAGLEIAGRDMDLCLKASLRAVELTRSRDADVLSTLAAVYAGRNDPQKAAEVQKQALEIATDEVSRDSFQERLDAYIKATRERRDVPPPRP